MLAPGKRTLGSKLLSITASIMLLISVVTLGAVAWMNYVTERERLADVEDLIRRSILSKGVTLTENHALALKSLVADNAFSDVDNLVTRATAQEDLVYGTFISAENQAWAYVSPTTRPSASKPTPDAWKELEIEGELLKTENFQRTKALFGKQIEEFGAAVFDEDGEHLGTVVYGLSTERMARAVDAARGRSRQALKKALVTIGLLGLLSFVLGIVLVRRAATRITGPITELTVAANQIAEGERGIRVSIRSGDEVEVLAGAFNHMLQSNEDAMQRLEVTTQRALEADRMKSEFLANMSHEIRTPMNGVLGVVKLMQTQPLDGKLLRYVETIDASANALLTIINDILDFSKLEAGKYTIQSISFQPRMLVQEVAELLAARAYDRNLELVYRIDPALPTFLIGDPDRLKQVLTNLVGNAIKFTDKGDVFIDIAVVAQDADAIVLRAAVHDTGIGIDSADLPKLFNMFSQVDGSLVRRHGGTGLGLAITMHLVKMMGGDIEVQSRVGVGSVFSFSVKLGLDVRESQPGEAETSGKRVLVVEASRWREIIAEHLDRWGMSCEVLDRGSDVIERLERARASNASFDALVLGTELRGARIEDLIGAIRERAAFSALPIILLSKVRPEAGVSELDGVVQLNKPVRFSELYNCLMNYAMTLRRTARAELGPSVSGGGGKKVLVVDDNEVNQFVASEQLEQLGYRVELASDGVEAVGKVKRGGLTAVLMDCQMPVMDGYTATEQIRAWEAANERPRIPIIALTAHALAGERERVLRAGMDDYLSKPCRSSSLDRVLRIHLKDADAEPLQPEANATQTEHELSPDVRRSEKLTRLFLEKTPLQIEALGRAIEQGPAAEVRALAHKLKGSCLAIEAPLMAKAAERLQKTAETGDLSAAPELFLELKAHHARIDQLLRQELTRLAKRTPANDGARASVRSR